MVNHWMENGDINKCMATLTASGRTIPYDRWVCYDHLSVDLRTLTKRDMTQLLELCMGVEYLHQERIVHGDIRGVSFSSLFFHYSLTTFFRIMS